MGDSEELSKKTVALAHVRAFHLWAADLRVKNFGFFVLLLAAMTGATVKLGPKDLEPMFYMGAVAGVAFFIIDLRTMQLIKDARAEEYVLEPYFDVSLHAVDKLKDGKRGVSSSGRNRLMSHTFVYRFVYLSTTATCVGILTKLINLNIVGKGAGAG